MEVRHIEPADVPGVIDLITRTLAEFGLEVGGGSRTDQELLELPGSYADHGGAFWVALASDGRLLGTCGVAKLDGGVFELRKMYLDPASRGAGLGARLLDVAVTWTREHGGTMLVLDTIDSMSRAISFYEAHGFVRDDAQIRGSRCTRGYARTL
jgi:putative acetyltransferase